MIVPIRRVNKALVLALAQLLSEAQAGELDCLAYVACNRRTGRSADAFGQVEPRCLEAAEALVDHLIQQSE